MGTKADPGLYDCYKNAFQDEPYFTVLARDRSAPRLVRAWAHQRQLEIAVGNKPDEDKAMVDEALACAEAMEEWREKNNGTWRTGAKSPITSMIEEAMEKFNALPREAKEEMFRLQRESWGRQDKD